MNERRKKLRVKYLVESNMPYFEIKEKKQSTLCGILDLSREGIRIKTDNVKRFYIKDSEIVGSIIFNENERIDLIGYVGRSKNTEMTIKFYDSLPDLMILREYHNMFRYARAAKLGAQ